MLKNRVLFRIMVILLLLAGSLPSASAVTAAAPETAARLQTQQSVNLQLADWGYDDVALVGPYSIASYSIGLPYNWRIQAGSTLSLPVSYVFGGTTTVAGAQNGLGRSSPAAALDVKLNGKGIYRAIFNDVGQQTLNIALPEEWPVREEDYDRLDVTFHVYGPCEDATFGSLTISKSAALSLKYLQNQDDLDLSMYPVPFYQRTFAANAVDMVLPENPSQPEFTAGMAVAAGLGSLTNNQVAITSVADTRWDANAPSQENVIVVGTPNQNRLIAQLYGLAKLPVPLQKRRFDISMSGSSAFEPGIPLTYVLTVSNPEAAPANNLQLTSLLPDQAEAIQCDPACGVERNTATWKFDSLAPGASTSLKLTFTLPQTYAKSSFSFSSELAQDQQAVNVSTLSIGLQTPGEAAGVQSKPASDYFFVMDGRAVPENVGVIQLLASPWQVDKGLLLVTGLTDEAVYKAGNALGASVHFPGMTGQAALVEEVLPKEATARQQAQDITLAQLGYKDQTVTGIGRKNIFYTFDIPLNWNLTEDASVRLAFSHSKLLDPANSSLTILLNDTPIASAVLDESNAVNGELVGQLAPGSAVSGQKNALLVQIEADINDVCVDPETTQAWVSIASGSNLHLAHQTVDIKSLSNFDHWPHQFTSDLTLSNVLFSLPEQPTAVESTIALQTAAFLGTASGGTYFAPNVVTGKPDGMDLSKYHVITIGSPTRNPVLQSINDALPQPFILGTNKILQKLDNIVFQLPDNLNLGYLQLIPSPWNPERAVLAITGTTDAGLQEAATLVTDAGKIWQLKGDLALVRDAKIYTTNTRELTKKGNEDFLTTAVPEVTPTMLPTATADPGAAVQPTDVAGVSAEAPKTLAQQYPYLIPGLAGFSALLIVVILVFVARKSRRGM